MFVYKAKLNNTSFYSVLYILITAVVFLFAFILLRFPENAGDGIKKGIELCAYTLIPSMYPFMFLSSFVCKSGLSERLSFLFSFVTKKLFRLPGICGSLIFLSMVGGLPIGGKMTGEFYEKGYISKNQGRRLMLFCINPGPAFVISGVGYYMLGSKTAGIIIFISLLLSSFTVGFLSRFVYEDEVTVKKEIKPANKPEIQSAVVASVYQSGKNMLMVCAWVILFSCIIQTISLLPLSENVKLFLSCIMEISTGCESAAKSMPLPVISAIIGFSGFCGQMQLMADVAKLKLPVKYFLSARVVNASLAAVYSVIMLKIFPLSTETISLGRLPQRVNNDFSVSVILGVVLMVVLLLLGEDYKIRKKQRR